MKKEKYRIIKNVTIPVTINATDAPNWNQIRPVNELASIAQMLRNPE